MNAFFYTRLNASVYFLPGKLVLFYKPSAKKSKIYDFDICTFIFVPLFCKCVSCIWNIVAQTVTNVSVTIYLSSFFSFSDFPPFFFRLFFVLNFYEVVKRAEFCTIFWLNFFLNFASRTFSWRFDFVYFDILYIL